MSTTYKLNRSLSPSNLGSSIKKNLPKYSLINNYSEFIKEYIKSIDILLKIEPYTSAMGICLGACLLDTIKKLNHEKPIDLLENTNLRKSAFYQNIYKLDNFFSKKFSGTNMHFGDNFLKKHGLNETLISEKEIPPYTKLPENTDPNKMDFFLINLPLNWEKLLTLMRDNINKAGTYMLALIGEECSHSINITVLPHNNGYLLFDPIIGKNLFFPSKSILQECFGIAVSYSEIINQNQFHTWRLYQFQK